MPDPSAPRGPLATAGKLVFQSTGDRDFKAFSATDGSLSGHSSLATAEAPAATYEIEGQPYVALRAGPNVRAFKLGGAPAPNRPAKLRPSKAFPDDDTPTREIARTSQHRSLLEPGSRYCTGESTFDPAKARIASMKGCSLLTMTTCTMRLSPMSCARRLACWITLQNSRSSKYRATPLHVRKLLVK